MGVDLVFVFQPFVAELHFEDPDAVIPILFYLKTGHLVGIQSGVGQGDSLGLLGGKLALGGLGRRGGAAAFCMGRI